MNEPINLEINQSPLALDPNLLTELHEDILTEVNPETMTASIRGVARICGVEHTSLLYHFKQVLAGEQASSILAQRLVQWGFKGGVHVPVFIIPICLEFFGYDAKQTSWKARNLFRYFGVNVFVQHVQASLGLNEHAAQAINAANEEVQRQVEQLKAEAGYWMREADKYQDKANSSHNELIDLRDELEGYRAMLVPQYTLQDLARELGLKEKPMIATLLDKGHFERGYKGKLHPAKSALDEGYATQKKYTDPQGKFTNWSYTITPKGIGYFKRTLTSKPQDGQLDLFE